MTPRPSELQAILASGPPVQGPPTWSEAWEITFRDIAWHDRRRKELLGLLPVRQSYHETSYVWNPYVPLSASFFR